MTKKFPPHQQLELELLFEERTCETGEVVEVGMVAESFHFATFLKAFSCFATFWSEFFLLGAMVSSFAVALVFFCDDDHRCQLAFHPHHQRRKPRHKASPHPSAKERYLFRSKSVILWAHLVEECAKVRKYPGITSPSGQLVHRGKLLRRRGYQGPKRVAWRRKSALGSDCPNFFLTLSSCCPSS